MADDSVVEVGNIERAIRSKRDVDGPEPGIVADDEVGLFDGRRARSRPFEAVVIDPGGHGVADEDRPAPRFRKVVGVVMDNSGDAG